MLLCAIFCLQALGAWAQARPWASPVERVVQPGSVCARALGPLALCERAPWGSAGVVDVHLAQQLGAVVTVPDRSGLAHTLQTVEPLDVVLLCRGRLGDVWLDVAPLGLLQPDAALAWGANATLGNRFLFTFPARPLSVLGEETVHCHVLVDPPADAADLDAYTDSVELGLRAIPASIAVVMEGANTGDSCASESDSRVLRGCPCTSENASACQRSGDKECATVTVAESIALFLMTKELCVEPDFRGPGRSGFYSTGVGQVSFDINEDRRRCFWRNCEECQTSAGCSYCNSCWPSELCSDIGKSVNDTCSTSESASVTTRQQSGSKASTTSVAASGGTPAFFGTTNESPADAPNIGLVVGVLAAAIVAIALCVGAIFFFVWRRHRFQRVGSETPAEDSYVRPGAPYRIVYGTSDYENYTDTYSKLPAPQTVGTHLPDYVNPQQYDGVVFACSSDLCDRVFQDWRDVETHVTKRMGDEKHPI